MLAERRTSGPARPVGFLRRMQPYAAVARPTQWLKNAFVLAPLVFSRAFLDASQVCLALEAAVCFSLAASAAYILNDLAGAENDRRHPEKRLHRPIAAGTLPARNAVLFLLGICGLLAAALFRLPLAAPPVLGYLAITALYSWKLRQLPWVDILVLVAGFLLRLQAGAAPLGIHLSFWMLSTTACLALYVAALKRRAEYRSIGSQARGSLRGYSVRSLNALAAAGAGGSILFYAWFIFTVRMALLPTLLLAVAGILRYAYVANRGGDGESPAETVVRDVPLLLILAAWGGCSIVALAR